MDRKVVVVGQVFFFFFFWVVGQDSNSVMEGIGVQVAQVFGVHVVQAMLGGYHIS